ncbi:ChaB family protein [Nonomuraea sp. NPDC046802]|uniref:ChaB family protein n=1 Tax=Nonomuraea sp. NPDC046802 TaxID=3154919 RepID=UPI0034037E16
MPAVQELPSTIKRSPKKAQNTWIKAHDSAVKEYGEGRRAHMTAFAALKNSFEKVGDHWEPKNGKGPSRKASMSRATSRATSRTKAAMGRTAKAATTRATRMTKAATSKAARMTETVSASDTREHLQMMAAKLNVVGRSKMTKQELINAIRRAKRRAAASTTSRTSATRTTTSRSRATPSRTTRSTTTSRSATSGRTSRSGTSRSGTSRTRGRSR